MAMLLFIMHKWTVDLRDVLDYFEGSTDFHRIANDQSVLPNQFSDMSYVLSWKYHAITDPTNKHHQDYKDTSPQKLE